MKDKFYKEIDACLKAQKYKIHNINKVLRTNINEDSVRQLKVEKYAINKSIEMIYELKTRFDFCLDNKDDADDNDHGLHEVKMLSNNGNTHREEYGWKNDNTVRQGNYSRYGNSDGIWLFGEKFNEIKDKDIKEIELVMRRQTGGLNKSVTHTIKMHSYECKPNHKPIFLDWSKEIDMQIGEVKNVKITDKEVIDAIKHGVCKGFGLKSSYDTNHYSVCSGALVVRIIYK